MATPLRVLIIEDSDADTELLVVELRRGSYEPEYEQVQAADQMIAALNRQTWDIVFCDYTMPHFSGMDALNLVKDRGLDLPFIFLSGTIGEDAAVDAMKAGAHDYIMKGNTKRLIPAVKRELRESQVRQNAKRSRDQLQQSEERFRQLAENITEVFWLIKPDLSQILYISPGYEKIWGRTCQSLYESSLSWAERSTRTIRNGS